jgi:hypothetical protein
MRLILQHTGGRVVNDADIYGWTALQWAVTMRYEECVRVLLRNGADPTLRDNHGKTPRDSILTEEEDDEQIEEGEHIRREEGRVRCAAVFDVSRRTCFTHTRTA